LRRIIQKIPAELMHASSERRPSQVQLGLHHYRALDIAEMITDPAQLYTLLSFGFTPEEVLSFEVVHPILERIIAV
jgi:hypothetical protein